MTKIILSGCNGKMGQVITRLAAEKDDVEIVAGLDINTYMENPYPVYTNPKECGEEADVIIDFSHPSAFDGVVDLALRKNMAIVICTTGLSLEQRERINEISKEIPTFFSANMSLGVNLLIELSKKAAQILSGFDIEIVERHHNQKIDAPSGTALAIADEISSVMEEAPEYVYDRYSVRRKRSKNEIGLHAVRGGTIVGDHDVIFAGNDEVIELKHSAASKEVFAVGALRAASFMKGKGKGFYSMKELIAE